MLYYSRVNDNFSLKMRSSERFCYEKRNRMITEGYGIMKALQKGRVSGFTLLEMMIVVAIIAILTGVLVPAMMGYTRNSRLNSANSNAKVLFNSLQTVMQEYEFLDRNANSVSAFYGSGTNKQGHVFIRANRGVINDFVTTSISDPSASGNVSPDFYGADARTAAPATFSNRLDRLFSEYRQVSWSAYVENYSVRGVLCADDYTTSYVGGYPLKPRERADSASISASCTATSISTANESQMVSYCTDAWS
ncbi:MAG TPA: hypothetical protein DCG49_13235 [Ruminococcus sp.]|nr:hypothetical protein [Ruminococcus sp.]